MEKSKIAVIGLKGLPAFGGAASVGESLINELKDKYDFFVYATSSHTHLKTGKYNGFNQIVFKRIPLKKLNTLYYYILSCLHVLFIKKYDLIHLHHSDAAFLLYLLRLKYRVIVTTHGAQTSGLTPKWIKYKWFFQGQIKFLKKANVVTCVSKSEKTYIEDKIHKDVIHIPNGIKIYESLPAKVIDDDYLMFGAGRIMESKGLGVLLKALKLIDYKGMLIVAGDLEQTKNHKKEVLELSEGLNIDFCGLIKQKDELLSLIKYAKFFLFPSSMEAMSMMLLEAASVNTPVIASDIKENKDVFSDEHVLFFRTNDEADLADKIEYALKNRDLMAEKAEKAYKYLLKEYNWKNIAIKYSNIYDDLIVNK